MFSEGRVMENFVYDIGTKVYFGKNQINQLSTIIPCYGKRVLVVYGGGSIKRNGIYDSVCKQLDLSNSFYTELSGIGSNPKLSFVIEGRKICLQEKIDVVLAVGGGSVIDCAKAIAAAVYYDGNPWDFVKNPGLI